MSDFPRETLDAYMKRHSSECIDVPCRRCEMIECITQHRDALQTLCPGNTEKDRLISAVSVIGGRILLDVLARKEPKTQDRCDKCKDTIPLIKLGSENLCGLCMEGEPRV